MLVVFLASLLVATFARLSQQPTGFSSDGVIALEAVAKPARTPAAWNGVAERLRAVPGVEAVALTDQALLVNDATNGYVSVGGRPPTRTLAFFRDVSPGWLDVMRIPLMDGRDVAAGDTAPGVAIVNEMFAKTFVEGQNPVGRSFTRAGSNQTYRIVGLIRDVRYRSLREPILPIAFVPFQQITAEGAFHERAWGTLLIRTRAAGDPLALAPALRETVSRAQPGFRVSTIRTQTSLIEQHTVRERLLATLAAFFAFVALALAAVGLFGVLHYSVLQRQRELGIRLAMGARAGDIVRWPPAPAATTAGRANGRTQHTPQATAPAAVVSAATDAARLAPVVPFSINGLLEDSGATGPGRSIQHLRMSSVRFAARFRHRCSRGMARGGRQQSRRHVQER